MENLKSFKKFLQEQTYSGENVGLYVSVTLKDPEKVINNKIFDALRNLVTFEDPENLHCTIIYGKGYNPNIDEVKQLNKTFKPISGTIYDFDYWDGHDNIGYLVLKVSSDYLIDRHNKYKKLGVKPTFDYSPHITLAKNFKLTDEIKNAMSIRPNINIIFNKELIDDITE